MRPSRPRVLSLTFIGLLATVLPMKGETLSPLIGAQGAAPSYTLFESGQVRPLAMSPDGKRLYAVNTPDNRVEAFDITDLGLQHRLSIPVGMEPVAVAARTDTEIWVVNKLSDSVSVVRDDSSGARVIRTLAVGDEPQDIVFAGPNRSRAFIAVANRDFNRPAGSRMGNADVRVFDASSGLSIASINLYSEVPRALAVTPDGSTVYVAAFQSGNRSTLVGPGCVDGDYPPPLTNVEGAPAPPGALVVQFDGEAWLDGAGRDWSHCVRITMADTDVFVIDAMATTPKVVSEFAGVGTTLFNMAVNPVSGEVYVSNTEAQNRVRFSGPGQFGGSTVRGHLVESRITVLGTSVLPRHLNKHIDYAQFPGTPAENDASLAFPQEMAVSQNGQTLYVAALGSSKIGVFDTGELRDNTFVPSPSRHISVSGGGPSGVMLDEARGRLYVLTRFDNSVTVIDLALSSETAKHRLYNPEPPSVTTGRRFLYDARLSSSRGDSACASCHMFGDTDQLAWDLGDPDGSVASNPNPFKVLESGEPTEFHPMKGPMVTQSLRGMANHGPLHWRGDRTGGDDPGGDPLDVKAAFKKFNGAFPDLLGRSAPLTEGEMQAFADFAVQITYPPNPIRRLDNTLTKAQIRGRDVYFNLPVAAENGFACNTCHVLDPAKGFFGSDGLSVTRSANPGTPVMKVPHLRNLYTKLAAPESRFPVFGAVYRGFGFNNDGIGGKLLLFLSTDRFVFPGDDDQRKDLIEFLRAFDSNLAPIVGQQVTLGPGATDATRQSFNRLIARADAGECDLIAKGNLEGRQRGFLYQGAGSFQSDRSSEAPYPTASLVPGKGSQEITFTCTPPGSGRRMGIDRDEDGALDGDEVDKGSNPADPNSVPAPAG